VNKSGTTVYKQTILVYSQLHTSKMPLGS